jgi:hypothetical protein
MNLTVHLQCSNEKSVELCCPYPIHFRAQCLIKHMENSTFTPLEVLNIFTEGIKNSASQKD